MKQTRLILTLAAVCLLIGLGAGLLLPRLFGDDECVASVATGRTIKGNPLGVSGSDREQPIINKVAGRRIDGVCVPNR